MICTLLHCLSTVGPLAGQPHITLNVFNNALQNRHIRTYLSLFNLKKRNSITGKLLGNILMKMRGKLMAHDYDKSHFKSTSR